MVTPYKQRSTVVVDNTQTNWVAVLIKLHVPLSPGLPLLVYISTSHHLQEETNILTVLWDYDLYMYVQLTFKLLDKFVSLNLNIESISNGEECVHIYCRPIRKDTQNTSTLPPYSSYHNYKEPTRHVLITRSLPVMY